MGSYNAPQQQDIHVHVVDSSKCCDWATVVGRTSAMRSLVAVIFQLVVLECPYEAPSACYLCTCRSTMRPCYCEATLRTTISPSVRPVEHVAHGLQGSAGSTSIPGSAKKRPELSYCIMQQSNQN